MKKTYSAPALNSVEFKDIDIMTASQVLGGADPYMSDPDSWEKII